MSNDDSDESRLNEPNPERSDVEVDAAWAEIVARWDAVAEPRPGIDAPFDDRTPIDDRTDARGTSPDSVDLRAHDSEAQTRSGLEARNDPNAGHGSGQSSDRAAGELSWDNLFDRSEPANRKPERPDEPIEPSPTAGATHRGPRDVAPDGPSLLDGLDGVGDPDGDHYRPPEPPPLPRPSLLSGLAWLGAIGAPIFLLIIALFWREAPALVIGLAVVAFVAGFITLVVRLPDHPDTDDGAVV